MRFYKPQQGRHKWFAWYPVKTTYHLHGSTTLQGTWIWLELVYREKFTHTSEIEYGAIDKCTQ